MWQKKIFNPLFFSCLLGKKFEKKNQKMQFAEYGCGRKWIHVSTKMLTYQDTKEPILIKNELFGPDPVPNRRKYLRVKSELGWSYVLEGSTCFYYELAQPCIGDFTSSTDVTFIIPSIGRPTLTNALQSLEATKSKHYKTIVVFDGLEECDARLQEYKTRNHVTCLYVPKVGFSNCAGEVRNIGIKSEWLKSEWIAFVDDDDQVTPDYMYRLQQEIFLHPNADVILFRMLRDHHVIPQANTIRQGDVGISFAMKRSLCLEQGHWFKPSGSEDFDLLNRLQRAKCVIHISSYITYLVR